MHEDLLGYLLGALEPLEMRRIEKLLRTDPLLQAELERVRESLRPLEDHPEATQGPPSDLVSRTLDALPPLPLPTDEFESGTDSVSNNAANSKTNPVAGVDSEDSVVHLPQMHDGVEPSRAITWTWMDWAASAVAVAVLLGLLLPTLAEGRFESRRVACQDQLRQFGTALTQYVSRDAAQRLPAVAESGPEAFAGVYAVRLKDAGLLPDESIRWCPSFDPPGYQKSRARFPHANFYQADQPQLPIPVQFSWQLHEASVDRLKAVQRSVGGHYAYTLGVVENDQLTPPKFESRSSFAVMADAPMPTTRSSSDNGATEYSSGHSGRGINVLYESGRVQFIPIESLDALIDHPLQNHLGETEAGVNIDDASLAPSSRPPFLRVKQR